MVKTPEGKLKEHMRRYLTERGAFWSNVTGGPGSKPGDPDMIACYRGLYIGLEAKTPTGTVSPLQEQRKAEIEAAGGLCFIIRGMDDLKEALREADGEFRRRG